MKKIIGYAVLSLPFLALFLFTLWGGGWDAVLFVFGGCALSVGCIWAGVTLTNP